MVNSSLYFSLASEIQRCGRGYNCTSGTTLLLNKHLHRNVSMVHNLSSSNLLAKQRRKVHIDKGTLI